MQNNISDTEQVSVPRRVGVTGALGFVGKALSAHYRELGAEVCGVDIRGDSRLGVVAGDIGSPGGWQKSFMGCDLVIHTAAIVSNIASRDACWKTNVAGTRNVLDAAVGCAVPRFVHFSSVDAYSIINFPDNVDEKYPLRVDGDGYHYGESKIAGEQLVWQAHAAGEIQATVIRPTDIYGPNARANIVLPLEYIKAGQMVLPATGYINPVYIDDLVDGVARAGNMASGIGHAFNIGGGQRMLTQDFFLPLFKLVGKKPRVMKRSTLIRVAGAFQTVSRLFGVSTEMCPASIYMLAKPGGYSIEKAQRRLGYAPAMDYDKGMARTVQWLKENALVP